MDYCIVLVEMLLARFLVDCLSSGNSVHIDHASAVKKKRSSKVCGWICSVWPSWVWESQHASTGNSVSWSLADSSRSNFHRRSLEHQELRDLN